MTHERALERWVLLQDVAVVLVSLWLAHLLRTVVECLSSPTRPCS